MYPWPMQDATTRDRLIAAATTLFADHGFRGAAVRDICNQARVNPGAVSYHFGGKKQLYRAVLRAAVNKLAEPGHEMESEDTGKTLVQSFLELEETIRRQPGLSRLILRDVADGGKMAIEALSPALRGLQATVADSIGAPEGHEGQREVNRVILRLASPIVLRTVAWPVLERVLQLDSDDSKILTSDAVRFLTGLANPPKPRS